MKKTLFAVALLASVVACTPKHDGYIIKGTVDGIKDGQAVITNGARQEPIISDTVEVKNGKFEFKGKVATPENYILSIGDKQVRFFLDNSTITVTGSIDSLDKAEVKGSAIVDAIKAMGDKKQEMQKSFNERTQINEMMTEYRQAGTTPERKKEIEAAYNALRPEMNAMYKEFDNIDSTYMAENPYSPYTVVLLRQKQGDMELDKLSEMVTAMSAQPELAENRFVKEIAENIIIRKNVEIGKPAPDFTQNDPEGNPITFSDIYKKNKITMIDFWASWCGPCRAFNPTLVKIYKKYQPKGLEIFGVSLDRDHEAWLKGIKDDKLPWPQVSDVKFWDNAAAKLYYIRYIPQNVFVDASGNIVAKQLGEEEIEKFLDEHLK